MPPIEGPISAKEDKKPEVYTSEHSRFGKPFQFSSSSITHNLTTVMDANQILPRVVKSSDELETRNSNVEFHSETVGTLPESKQGHDSRATVSNTLHLTCCLYLIYYTNFYLAFNLH